MKSTVFSGLLLLTVCSCLSVKAQGDFAPVGAEWYYYLELGNPFNSDLTRNIIQVWSDKDTLIEGTACRKVNIKHWYKWKGTSSHIPHQSFKGPFYFYDNKDTVFVHNETFDRFTPLYVYNVKDGDTVCLPVPPSPEPDLRIHPMTGDTSFCFVIDSVRSVLYDTSYLRTYYTRIIAGSNGWEPPFPVYTWGWAWSDKGTYVERIFSPASFFPAKRMYCYDCNPFEYQYMPAGSLRCYADSGYRIKLTPDPCDTIESFSVSIPGVVTPEQSFTVYPNPAGTHLHIELPFISSVGTLLYLYDLSGSLVFQWTVMEANPVLDITNVPAGMYVLRLQTPSTTYNYKLVVQR